MKKGQLPFIIRFPLVLVSILILGYLIKIGQFILSPLLFALLMAFLFFPFASFLEKKMKCSRSLSTFLSVLNLCLVLFGVSYFFVTQLESFSEDFPQLEKQFSVIANELQRWVARNFHINVTRQMTYINQGVENLISSTGAILAFSLNMFTSLLAFISFTALFFIFILQYRSVLYRFITSIFQDKHFDIVQSTISRIQKIIKQYLVGLLIQVIIVSVITSIFLSVLDVKYAILIGVLTGLLNLIPYIGITLSGLFACFVAFATGANHVLIIIIGYVIIHIIDANLTLPLVVGSKVKINALFAFIGLLVGEQLWGISGMFLSIPLLAILKIIFVQIEYLRPWGEVLGDGESAVNSKKESSSILVDEE